MIFHTFYIIALFYFDAIKLLIASGGNSGDKCYKIKVLIDNFEVKPMLTIGTLAYNMSAKMHTVSIL